MLTKSSWKLPDENIQANISKSDVHRQNMYSTKNLDFSMNRKFATEFKWNNMIEQVVSFWSPGKGNSSIISSRSYDLAWVTIPTSFNHNQVISCNNSQWLKLNEIQKEQIVRHYNTFYLKPYTSY